MNRLNMVKHQNKEDNITIMKKMMLQEKNKNANKHTETTQVIYKGEIIKAASDFPSARTELRKH